MTTKSDVLYVTDTDVIGERPKSKDYADTIEYMRACNAFDDAVTAAANRAFDTAFRNAVRNPKPKKKAKPGKS